MGEENTITADEVLLAFETLQAVKAACFYKIRLEMLNAVNRVGVIWLNCVCKMAWCCG